MSEDNYGELKFRLKLEAKKIGRLVGFSNYDVDGAEKDFVEYFKKYGDIKIQIYNLVGYYLEELSHFGFNPKLISFLEYMGKYGEGLTGSCNPYSPIIIASSELASDFEYFLNLYFKLLYDYFWMDFFLRDHNPEIKLLFNKIFSNFKLYWSGAEKIKTPYYGKFYEEIRNKMKTNEYRYKYKYPFMVYVTLYHTIRSNQWQIIDKLKRFLFYCYDDKKNYVDKGFEDNFGKYNISNSPNFNKYPGEYIPFEDYFFLTECNIIPAKQSGDVEGKENIFIEYVLNNFKTPRIIILNPSKGKELDLYKGIPENKRNFFHIKRTGQKKWDIEVFSYYNGHCIHTIFKTSYNLTPSNSIPDDFLFFLANKIKEIGGIYYE